MRISSSSCRVSAACAAGASSSAWDQDRARPSYAARGRGARPICLGADDGQPSPRTCFAGAPRQRPRTRRRGERLRQPPAVRAGRGFRALRPNVRRRPAPARCRGRGACFCAARECLYPQAQTVMVHPGPLCEELEGRFRPGFFNGVSTVVLKLFNVVQPVAAVFGKKDYQQLAVVRQMVRQLDLPIEIVAGETARERDGLAMSSRNAYLSPAERVEAPRLYRVLQAVSSGKATAAQAFDELAAAGWKPDYIEVRRRADLKVPRAGEPEVVVLGAGRLGRTRLIDSLEF